MLTDIPRSSFGKTNHAPGITIFGVGATNFELSKYGAVTRRHLPSCTMKHQRQLWMSI